MKKNQNINMLYRNLSNYDAVMSFISKRVEKPINSINAVNDFTEADKAKKRLAELKEQALLNQIQKSNQKTSLLSWMKKNVKKFLS